MSDPLSPYTLASISPRRRSLLARTGVVFDVVDSGLEETRAEGVSPELVARHLALAKARSAARRGSPGTIIAGDTVVACDGVVLGKPLDRRDAAAILRRLSGSTHQVISAVALLHVSSGFEESGVDVTDVTMRPMSEAEIRDYVDSGEADDKAGAYAIQETGDRFVTAFRGEYDTVVGFPTRLFELLRDRLARRVVAGG